MSKAIAFRDRPFKDRHATTIEARRVAKLIIIAKLNEQKIKLSHIKSKDITDCMIELIAQCALVGLRKMCRKNKIKL